MEEGRLVSVDERPEIAGAELWRRRGGTGKEPRVVFESMLTFEFASRPDGRLFGEGPRDTSVVCTMP